MLFMNLIQYQANLRNSGKKIYDNFKTGYFNLFIVKYSVQGDQLL